MSGTRLVPRHDARRRAASARPRRRIRVAFGAALGLALALGVLFGGAHVLSGRSTTARAIAWMESDIGDRHRFPSRAIRRSGAVSRLSRGPETRALDSPVPDETLVGVPLDDFLQRHATRAFVALRAGRIVHERYFNGGGPEKIETSFSMAKSFTSTLIGIALDEGAIRSVDDPITRYLPELERRDERFGRIRIRDLLTMSSGLRYVEKGTPWSDDAVTYYGVDLREIALDRARIERPPGREWRYNNYNPLLLGLILERATRQPVAGYMSSRLWRPLGAEADASWSLDSRQSGFEKMESGINARARDFARFGLLMLEGGRRGGRQVVSREWVRKSTSAAALDDPADFYGAMWWVDRQPGARRDPFFARGKYGQMIAVVPDQDLVFVRLGSHNAGVDWQEFLLDLAARMPLAR